MKSIGSGWVEREFVCAGVLGLKTNVREAGNAEENKKILAES